MIDFLRGFYPIKTSFIFLIIIFNLSSHIQTRESSKIYARIVQNEVTEKQLYGKWQLIYKSSTRYRSSYDGNKSPVYYSFSKKNKLSISTNNRNYVWRILPESHLLYENGTIKKKFEIYSLEKDTMKLRNDNSYLILYKL